MLHPIPLKWKWDFGTGDTSNLYGPHSIVYDTVGLFTISLTATDTLGCTNTLIKDSVLKVYFDSIPPDTPYILRATVEDDYSVLMQFSKNNEADLREYVLLYDFNNGFPNSTVVRYDANDTSFLQAGLNTLQNVYSYKMYAIDICRNVSGMSQTHTTVELKAKAISNAVQLDWCAYQGWDSVQRYVIFRNDPDKGNVFVRIDSTTADVLTYIDTNITCFKPYNYRILAVEFEGKKQVSWSDTANATPTFIPIVPGTRNIRATVMNNEYVRVEWRPRKFKLGFRYAIYRAVDSNTAVLYKYVNANDTILEDMDVNVQEHSYTYTTYLFDSCGGKSPVSNEAKTILLKVDLEENDILKYDPMLTWNPYSDWYSGVAYYKLEFMYDSLGDWDEIARRGMWASLTATHKYVNLEQRDYCYRVTAYQKDSNDIFSESNEACISTKPRLYAPNVFTINGDKINDTYCLGGVFIDQYELRIYNRWGIKVFESFDLNECWDGTFEGKPCPSDVYVYYAKGIGRKKQMIELRGNITLLR